MIAYNTTGLHNEYVRKQAREAHAEGCISNTEFENIRATHAVTGYTPNFFVRVGLALLTLLIATCIFGLMALIMHVDDGFHLLIIAGGLACYGAAEYFVGAKKHRNSGVDNMLIWLAAYSIWGGIAWSTMMAGSGSTAARTAVVFVVCALLAVRFADQILATIAAAALLFCIVTATFWPSAGTWTDDVSAMILLIVSTAMYFGATKAAAHPAAMHYRHCLQRVAVVALAGIYGCYLLPPYMLGFYDTMPGIPAWICLFTVPVVYIAIGLRSRSVLFIRTGIILIAISILVFRQFHHVVPAEVALLGGGTLLLIVSWTLIRYLSTPKHGFTFEPEKEDPAEPDMDKVLTTELVDRAGGRH